MEVANPACNFLTPPPQVIESTSAAPQSLTIYFQGWDADGDLLQYMVTSLPSHGLLELQNTIDETTVPITDATFRCWEETTFVRYRLVWWPEVDSDEDATIGFKSWDGDAFSVEATITISIRAQDGLPQPVPKSYTIDEDTELFNISLAANDIDSEFVSVFVTDHPEHGRLYNIANDNKTGVAVRGKEIVRAYSQWEVEPPIEQFATNVRAVSTFWPAGDDAGNGYPSWHPFREYQYSCAFLFFLGLTRRTILLCYGRAFVACAQRFLGRRTRRTFTVTLSLVTARLLF